MYVYTMCHGSTQIKRENMYHKSQDPLYTKVSIFIPTKNKFERWNCQWPTTIQKGQTHHLLPPQFFM